MAEECAAGDDNSAEVAEASDDWRDKYLRLSAEFDNYRKRTLREKMELVAAGGEDTLKAMLPLLDDVDRALQAVAAAREVEAVREGVVLIAQKLRDTLRAKGVVEIESTGCDLDTDLHEAVAIVPCAPEQRGKIIDTAQKGYKLKDKVIRHAKVVVGE
jgi:molecular chaperone GrpE